MHPQSSRRFGHIEAGVGEHFVDPLPFNRLDRCLPFADRHLCIATNFTESAFDVVGIGGLGEIGGRAELDRLDRCDDASIAGQDE